MVVLGALEGFRCCRLCDNIGCEIGEVMQR